MQPGGFAITLTAVKCNRGISQQGDRPTYRFQTPVSPFFYAHEEENFLQSNRSLWLRLQFFRGGFSFGLAVRIVIIAFFRSDYGKVQVKNSKWIDQA